MMSSTPDIGFCRVSITILNTAKHTLPVSDECGYVRGGGVARPEDKVCKTSPGTSRPENYVGLLNCMRESMCEITDNRLQMAILRDPRPMTVSAYFHQLRNTPRLVEDMTLDEYVIVMLPIICKWLCVRYFLFAEWLAADSMIVWYEDALSDPVGWHDMFFSGVGLMLPESVVEKAASAASDGGKNFGFPSKGRDAHPGGINAPDRTYQDEVNAATLSIVDDILRVWLPPVVLEKLGVSLSAIQARDAPVTLREVG